MFGRVLALPCTDLVRHHLVCIAVILLVSHDGAAQPTTPPTPPPLPASEPAPITTGLRLHVIGTENTYVPMALDVYSVATQQLVASATGVDEARGDIAPVLELAPGMYKLVRPGQPFTARFDYAIATVAAGTVTDFVIVVERDTLAFRGSGPLVGELPQGVEIAGVRISLSGGGSLMFNQVRRGVGTTSGTNAQIGLFGNFGLVLDRRCHFFEVGADMRLDLLDAVTGSVWPTYDRFQASALYAYKAGNRHVGPYVRAALRTRIFPGYLYLERGMPGQVQIERLDGTTEIRDFGLQADPDDLRIEVASAFAPLRLQEEVGANLKAVDLDLLVARVLLGTRIGFGFRQGFTNGLLVVRGKQSADPVVLREIDDYTTLGPMIGASAKVTFARWLYASGQFGLMAPLTNRDNAGTSFARRLLLDLEGTAGFKVPILPDLVYASADYMFRVERDGFVTAGTQLQHSLMVRANVTLF